MMPAEFESPVVHVVEDDDSARAATARLLRVAGYAVHTHSTSAAFLASMPIRTPGCVVLDLQMPGPNGLDIQAALAAADEPLPVVFLSGRGDVAQSVQAMKAGAVDFLTKSAEAEVVLRAVASAVARDARDRERRVRERELRARYDRLSAREREVFAHLISGQLNKQVGFDLGISLQTTKIHRHRVLEKMQASSIVELARMAEALGVEPVGAVRWAADAAIAPKLYRRD
jgi:FixJ family two-component response regulator